VGVVVAVGVAVGVAGGLQTLSGTLLLGEQLPPAMSGPQFVGGPLLQFVVSFPSQ